jgi:hypothetical protein
MLAERAVQPELATEPHHDAGHGCGEIAEHAQREALRGGRLARAWLEQLRGSGWDAFVLYVDYRHVDSFRHERWGTWFRQAGTA